SMVTTDPAAVSPLEFSHPQRNFLLSCSTALKQGSIFSSKTPDAIFPLARRSPPDASFFGARLAAKEKTLLSVHTISEEKGFSLAALSITLILRVESLT